jgi:hypothetical protein
MGANASQSPPAADATGRTAESRVQRAAAAVPELLLALALASLAGFITVAGLVLVYDANAYGYGLLARYDRSSTDALSLALVVLGPVVFAFATWWRGIVGALVALAGFAIIGPWLATMTPLSDEPSVRLVCCDGVRSLQLWSALIFGIAGFLIVMPITFVVRWAWRRVRAAGRASP